MTNINVFKYCGDGRGERVFSFSLFPSLFTGLL